MTRFRIQRNKQPVAIGLSSATNVSIDELQTKLTKQKDSYIDVATKIKGVKYTGDGLLHIKDAGAKFVMTPWSFGQWCKLLGVPVEFMRKCPEGTGPASQKAIFDHWRQHVEDKALFLRLKKYTEKDKETEAVGRVRAVLTDRYSVYDNLDLLEALNKPVKDEEMVIQKASITDEAFYLRTVWPVDLEIGKTLDDKPDVFQLGYQAANSEIGFRDLTGDLYLYRQICTNGLVAMVDQVSVSARHIGLKRNEIKDRIAASIEQGREYAPTLQKLIEQRQSEKFGGTPEQALAQTRTEIQKVLRGHGSREFVDSALRQLDLEPQTSPFGVVQAITSAARNMPIHSRAEVEAVAGQYLMAA